MIYVLGGVNRDVFIELERVPKKGEAVMADGYRVDIGGKGALQAAVIAKLANRPETKKKYVKFIGKVGEDAVGVEIKDRLASIGVDTEFLRAAHRNTGMTVVTKAAKDTRTVMYGGANNIISKTDIDEALEHATASDTLLVSLESPLYIVTYALRKARQLGMTTVLNPTSVSELPDDIYYSVDIIIVSSDEVQALTGINPVDFEAQKAAMRAFHMHGVQYVVLELGDNGAALSDGAYIMAHLHSLGVEPIDSAGVLETFVGALTLTYPHIGMYSFREACLFAMKAAAITASHPGAIESFPTIDEVMYLYNGEIE